MEKLSRIIEQVYSAALEPALWPVAVQSMQTHFDCVSAGFYVQDLQRSRLDLVHVSGVDPAYVRDYATQHVRHNPWNEPELQAPGKIRTERSLDEHFNTPGLYRSTALFNEWMKPQDFIYTLGTNLIANRRERTKLFLYRAARTGPFSRRDIEGFEWLLGHLMNAAKVASRLGQQASRTEQTLELLEQADVGGAFIDEDGYLIEANAFAQALFVEAQGLRVECGVVAASRRDDAAKLSRALSRALEVRNGRSIEVPRAVKLRVRSGARKLDVRIVPLPRRADPLFRSRRAAVALVITDSERDAGRAADELQDLYGFTAAEAKLVQWLLCGVSLRQAAELMHVKYETARWYLKNVFQKTGVRRQAELVRRLLTDRQMQH